MKRVKKILVSGCAGFIGARTCALLLHKGFAVVGIDNLNTAYDRRLKFYRLKALKKDPSFTFIKADIEDLAALKKVFKKNGFKAVINLAARAGVRYSTEDPFVYVRTNVLGCLNLLECARTHGVKKFVIASTSSLYASKNGPFQEWKTPEKPLSPYAASKKGAEALCQSYAHLYNFDLTVLRYFTVYGPAGRPDMSPFRFIHWILRGQRVQLTGDGRQSRDFTYVDDIARGTLNALNLSGFNLVNLGGHKPHSMNNLIRLIEKHTEKKARIKRLRTHRADAQTTWADISQARKKMGWAPRVGLEEGLKRTIAWHRKEERWLNQITL